jgi:hypothetical protein
MRTSACAENAANKANMTTETTRKAMRPGRQAVEREKLMEFHLK